MTNGTMLKSLGPRYFVAQWPQHWREEWKERAAIMEFDGEMSREDAELAAYHDIDAQRKPLPEPPE